MDSKRNQNEVDDCVVSSEPTENVKSSSKSCCHVNREMLPFKVHFFLLISAEGVTLPFLIVLAKDRVGISTTSLAAVLTMQQILFILTKPLIGYIADYFNKLKLIITIMTVMMTACLFALLAIPKVTDNVGLSLHGTDICDSYDSCKPLDFKQFPVLDDDEQSSIFVKSSKVCLFPKNDSDTAQELLEFLPSVVNNTHKSSNVTSNNGYKDGHHLFSLLESKYSFFQCKQNFNRSCATLTSMCFLCCHSDSDCNVVSCAIENNSTSDTLDSKKVSDFQTYEFWSFAIICTVALVCENGLSTLSNTACCESVHQNGADFGRQRIYGTIGWGCAAVIGGLLNDYTGDYLASWILMIILAVLTLINIKRMKLVKPQFSSNILKDVGTVLASKEYLACASNVFMCGLATGIIWYYLIWFLTTIGGSMFLCGLCNAVQSLIGELPFMFFSGWVIKKFGHFNIMTLALVAYCIRFGCYSYLHNPWFVLPVEVLHGFTYGLFYPTIVSYAKLKAKPGTEATSQALLFTLHEGLGAGLGCFVTGIAIDRIGTHQMFFFASIFSGCGAVISVILHLLIRRQIPTIVAT